MISRTSLLSLLLLLLVSATIDGGRQKAAFSAHYKGMLHYAEAQYSRAVHQFEKAHRIIPDNYNFNLSLGLALSRVGRLDEGLQLVNKSKRLLSPNEPDYEQLLATRSFFLGMMQLHGGRSGKAQGALRESIQRQEALGDPRRLSICHNALGYAVLMHQGGSDHGSDTLGMHYHVRKGDLLRALEQFDQAVKYDIRNINALYNYALLRDTLGLEGMEEYYAQQDSGVVRSADELPGNTERTLQFTDYDELLFLLDISGSMVMETVPCMGATRFEVMKQTALFILDSLPARTQLGLGTIDGDCGTEPHAWEPVGKLSRYDMRYRLRFLPPNGTTPLLERLQASPELFARPDSSRKSIFLISDGANICRSGGADICGWAEELARRNITINVLTFLDATASNSNAFAEYGCLADNTGGKILYMDNYRCGYEYFGSALVKSEQPRIPSLRRVSCWGPAVKDLWAFEPK